MRCGGQGALTCGRCMSASYCNAECQRADWKLHKRAMDALMAAATEPLACSVAVAKAAKEHWTAPR